MERLYPPPQEPTNFLALLRNALKNIPVIGDLVYQITGIFGGLSDLGSWFNDLGRALSGLNPFNGLWAKIQDIFFHQSAVQNTASSAADTAAQASTTSINVTNSVNYIADVVNVKAGRSFSESGPDPTGTPSFSFDRISDEVVTITPTSARGAVIRMDGASAKRGVTLMARRSAGTVNDFRVDLLKMAPNGDWSEPMQTSANIADQLGGGFALLLVNLPSDFNVDLGETWGLQFRVAAGGGSVEMPSNTTRDHLPLTSIVPQHRGFVRDASNGTPAMGAQAFPYSRTVPWCAIGIDLATGPPLRYFTNNFNYDTATMRSQFTVFSTPGGDGNAPVIDSNSFSYNRSTSNDGYAAGAFQQPLISDNWFVEVRCGGMNDRPMGIYVGTADGTGTILLVDVAQGFRYVRTQANGYRCFSNGGAVRGPAGSSTGGAGVYRLERRVDPTDLTKPATMHLFRNGVEIDTFVDDIALYPAGRRYFGPVASRFSFGTSYNPDDLAFGDIPVAA